MRRRGHLTSFVVLLMTASACTRSTGVSPAPSTTPDVPAGHSVVVSGMDLSTKLRCTATFPSSVVLPGRRTGVTFSVVNAGQRGVTIRKGVNGDAGYLELKDTSGNLLWRTSNEALSGPAPTEETLTPGSNEAIGSWDTPVLWPGMLRVTPVCSVLAAGRMRLTPVTIHVFAPGPAPGSEVAVSEALDAAGKVFANCAPSAEGPVEGTVQQNSEGRVGPQFVARCEAKVISQGGFDVVGTRTRARFG